MISIGSSRRRIARVSVLPIDAAPVERLLFAVTIAFAAGLVWLAERPPMVDLPQHAAQVALWRDLILGRSGWSDVVRINLLTPYLIGYAFTLPFSFVLPMEDAVRLVLSLAFIGYMGACIALRRSFGGDARLDWLFFFGFYGFAWQFGFLTFLVAAPVALLFLVVSNRFAKQPTPGGAGTVVCVGVVVLLSHGLQFAFVLGVGGLIAIGRNWMAGIRRSAIAIAPFIALATITIAFRWVTAQSEGAMHFDAVKYGEPLWLRPLATIVFATGLDLGGTLVLPALTLLAFFAPRFRGAVLQRGMELVPFAVLLVWLAVLPNYAFQTGFLFERFALYLIPFFALMFRPSQSPEPGWTFVPLACATWLMLGVVGYRIHGFEGEARGFETVLRAAAPEKRALALVFDPVSEAASNRLAYMHFASWYQADKAGFVDFNFAAFHPQIVRFRPGMTPSVDQSIGRYPERFDGNAAVERLYDYVFVRGSSADIAGLIAKSGCPLAVRAADAPWTLLERGNCPP